MRTRVKICGITNLQDALDATASGADALGFNMYSASPRFITVETTLAILQQLPIYVTTVGLFVNESADKVDEICKLLNFDLLQFHGNETDDFCRQFQRPFVKALRVGSGENLVEQIANFPNSRSVLLDAFVEGTYGGTGKVIDWTLLENLEGNWVLAGGLHADNVGEAIAKLKPFAVDVSGGVEKEKGQKDKNKMRDFIAAVYAADNEGKF